MIKRKKEEGLTAEWRQYSRCAEWVAQTGFKAAAHRNERFYLGDQWYGVKANNLPTPVFNIFKRIIDYVVAFICSSPIKISYVTGDNRVNEILNNEAESLWESGKMDVKLREALLNAAVSGDMCAHVFWDGTKLRPNGIRGDFTTEIIDAENVFFGDVTEHSVEAQPYIILAGRVMTQTLLAEAKKNGLPAAEIEKILPDTENDSEDGAPRTTRLIRYYRAADGFIHFSEATREAVLKSDVNTGLTRYPVAFASWTLKKGSYHGESFAGGIVPNQIFINKMFAMSMKSLMDTAFPKAIYDKTRVTGWSNAVGAALGVSGDISGVAKYLEGAGVDPNAMLLIDRAIKYTEDCLGATDVLLGQSVNPDNAAAITALGRNSAIPMETVKQNFYSFVEDIALIWLDFLKRKFTAEKELLIHSDSLLVPYYYSPSEIRNAEANVRVDVGPSAYFTELSSVSALSGLYSSGAINAVQYLKRLPKGYVPALNELIDELSSEPGSEDMPLIHHD